ncbi:MAG: hypothetical protein U0936_20425 [Planctomycetaceae bacterium]
MSIACTIMMPVVIADAIAIVTEWNEFRNPDFDYIKLKIEPRNAGGRNLYDRHKMAARGFTHSGSV